jgi:hypothetical protein
MTTQVQTKIKSIVILTLNNSMDLSKLIIRTRKQGVYTGQKTGK